MTMLAKNLIPGATYRIHHVRKGYFKARLKAVVPSDPGDLQDSQLLVMEIDTHRGSGQERLARSPTSVTETRIRPSLVLEIEQIDESWRMLPIKEVQTEMKSPPPPPPPPPTFAQRLKSKLGWK